MENKKRLSELLTDVSENQDTVNGALDRNAIILSKLSGVFFNITKKMGARTAAVQSVADALLIQSQADQQVEKVPTLPVAPQAEKVSAKKEQPPRERSKTKDGYALTALGAALMLGSDVIQGMVSFFKDPIGIITKLLSSVGEAINEFFTGDTFKEFILGAFEEGKKELTDVFANIKDIFSIIIGNPIANLLDTIKLSFINITKSGMEALPDWLKGDRVRDIQQKLEKVQEDIKAGKEARIAQEATTKKRIEVRNAKPEVAPTPTPKPEPEVQPPQVVKAPPPAAPTTTAAPVAGAPVQPLPPPAPPAEKKEVSPSDAKPVRISADQGKKAMLTAMDKYNVEDPVQRAAIMAQVGHESGNFTTLSENLNYRPTTLLSLFKKYFGSKDEAEQIASQGPVAIADRIYGGRMGNAPEGSGDGFKFRGRGFIQLTGKNNYQRFGVASNPDSVAQIDNAADTAMKYILNYKGDWNDIRGVTKFVNGGYIGLDDRQKYFNAYLNDPSITTAQSVQSPSNAGTQTAQLSASVNASKRQQSSGQVVYNINNSVATAVKVGAPQGSSTTIARPVGTA